jgi:hypothetical protein
MSDGRKGHRLSLPVRASRLGGLDRVHDVGSTVPGHPDPATLHAAVQVLLEEHVEGGEEVGHGSGS